MDASTQTLRERMAGYMRWLLGRETLQRQRQYEEQTIANGVIRQTLDPDQALMQQQRAAPYRAGEDQSLAQRLFDQQGQRTDPSRGVQEFIAQLDAQRLRLEAHRQAEQEQQQRGHDQGRGH
jgi:hypothetical protein